MAMMTAQTGDPYTYIVNHAWFLAVAIPFYFIGLSQGRIRNAASSQGESLVEARSSSSWDRAGLRT